MFNIRSFFIYFTLLFTLPIFAANYRIDPSHTIVQFTVRHMMISDVEGTFSKFAGSFNFDKKSGSADTITADIDTASINTNVAQRDEHLKSVDFFDAAQFPSMKFVSKSFQAGEAPNKKKVIGDLTIKGVTKEVVLDVEIGGEATESSGTIRQAFRATTKILRSDFGMKWNKILDAGGLLVSDEVLITIKGEAVRQ